MKVWTRILVVIAVFAVAALAAPAEPPAVEPAVEPALGPAVEAVGIELPDATPAIPPPLAPQPVDPWDDNYGTCHLDCGELETYRIDFVTYGDCCNTLYTCPGGGFPMGKYWRPYAAGGSPALCTT
jgi:hypothetical protein